MIMRRPRRCNLETVLTIRKIAKDNPGLGLRQIGFHFSPPISHDTVGKVLRGERSITIDRRGKLINYRGRPRRNISFHNRFRRFLDFFSALNVIEQSKILEILKKWQGVSL
jgi:hypothetical protein